MPDVRPEIREVYEMVTKQKPSEPGALARQHRRQVRTARGRKIGAFVLTAAMALLVVAVALRIDDRGGRKSNTDPDTGASEAEELSQDFADAFGRLDADEARSYLADDADVADLVTSLGDEGLEGSVDEMPLFFSMLDAMRFDQINPVCEESSRSSPTTDVRCTFSFRLLGGEAFGREWYRGTHLDFSVGVGSIERVSIEWDTERFSSPMWEPFARWVSRNHPVDAAVMYEDGTYGAAHLSKQSVRLWHRHVRGFIATFATNPGPPWVGRIRRTVDGIPFSLYVPAADWYQFGTSSLNKSIAGPQGAEAMLFWTSYPDNERTTACGSVLREGLRPTIADLSAALSTAPGTSLVAGPTEITVGGRAASRLVLTVEADAGCDPGYFFSWPDFRGGPLWPQTNAGDSIRLWIIDVDGSLVVFEAETNRDANAALEQEIDQIIGSIRFD